MSPLNEAVLGHCEARGWISPRVSARARSLCAHGPHLEQALVGARVVDADRYGEALSEASGLPFLRLDAVPSEAAPAEDWRMLGAWPLAVDGRSWRIAIADPTRERLEAVAALAFLSGMFLEAYAALASDMHSAWREVPAAHRPSLHGRRFRARMRGENFIQDEHAWDWSQAAEGLENLDGLTVVIHPDRHVRERLGVSVRPALDVLREGSGTVVWQVCDDQEREAAAQAALLGRKVVAVTDHAESFWDSLSDAGVPVRVIRAQHLSDGVAWESFPA